MMMMMMIIIIIIVITIITTEARGHWRRRPRAAWKAEPRYYN